MYVNIVCVHFTMRLAEFAERNHPHSTGRSDNRQNVFKKPEGVQPQYPPAKQLDKNAQKTRQLNHCYIMRPIDVSFHDTNGLQ